VSNALYGSSAALGSVAIIFVEGPGAVAATAGSAAASVAIGGREAVDMWDELGRLKEVYLDRRKREHIKDERVTRLGKVRQRQAELAMAAKGAACGGRGKYPPAKVARNVMCRPSRMMARAVAWPTGDRPMRLCRSAALAIGAPPTAVMMSPGRSPACAAADPGSTWATRAPDCSA